MSHSPDAIEDIPDIPVCIDIGLLGTTGLSKISRGFPPSIAFLNFLDF